MIEIDAVMVIALVVLATLITLAIWAPGPLAKWREAIAGAAVGVVGYILGRGTRRTKQLTDADDTPVTGVGRPTENKQLTEALERSDDLLDKAAHDPPADRPFADLSDDELTARLARATDDE